MAAMSFDDAPDVVLIGAGIMSATFGTVLKELEPSLRIAMFETLHDCAQESSEGWNNAGTGHAANCELNYTPSAPTAASTSPRRSRSTPSSTSRASSGRTSCGRARSRTPRLHPSLPAHELRLGAENVAFLKARYAAMSAHHCYHGMEYSEDPQVIASWAPLIIEGRGPGEPIAATRIVTGTDVDYGALTHLLVKQLAAQLGFAVHYNRKVVALDRVDDGRWAVTVEDTYDATHQTMTAKFVFIGAGGGSLPLLQASKIPEGRGYGGFPVSGIWLRCDVDAVSARHHAKVYGKAASGSPPMSVPHLDTRIIGGKRSLLFGPYAGFSSRFLKHGSLTDLFTALTPHNVVPLLDVAKDNVALTEYLVGQVLQSSDHQFATLKQFFPKALKQNWTSAVAGQRVQTIKPTGKTNPLEEGYLEFGTELVAAADHSICALLGASPGASTAAFIAVEVLEKCFADRLTPEGWLPRLKAVIPSYGIDLKRDAEACRRSRAETAPILRIDNV
ncbi:malate dehydrogenase (quinone) [Methylobacterium oryzae CBMB20]